MSCGDAKKPLHIVTPIVRSTPISKKAGFDVYLKLENLQVPGSFKIRGIGNLITKVRYIDGNVERQPNYVRKKISTINFQFVSVEMDFPSTISACVLFYMLTR